MSQYNLRPDPSLFLMNLRHMGYTLETAVADIIDNSITANATKISILYRYDNQAPWIAICDNGCGMDAQELISAMRFGSRNADESHGGEYDLGRFGLGLKVASLSQCRKVTVFSQKNGERNAACWDMDNLGDWKLQVSGKNELQQQKDANSPLNVVLNALVEEGGIWETESSNGTIVLWEHLDREYARRTNSLNDTISRMRDYLAMVFHRFLASEEKEDFGGMKLPKIRMDINRSPILPHSPFGNPKNSNRRRLNTVQITSSGCAVRCIPFILPPDRAYPPEERKRDSTKSGFTATQGFYVYRGGRLISRGSWFGLNKKESATQKLRVMLDIPATLDKEWSVDVRKSQIVVPMAVKNQLESSVKDWADEARRSTKAEYTPGARAAWRHQQNWECWTIQDKQDGFYHISAHINADNPIYRDLTRSMHPLQHRKFKAYLDCLTASFPVAAYIAAKDESDSITDDEELQKIRKVLDLMNDLGLEEQDMKIMLYQMKQFSRKNIDSIFNKK